jgi:mRNA-degrading endonuclease RelE of RelBE toxin-antitoxin system
MNYEIIPLPEFERQVKRLRKKYRYLKEDLTTLRLVLLANPKAGEAIPGLHNKVYKLRLASSDIERGKSGGFRVIYYFIHSDRNIYLLTIYPKSEKENVQAKEIAKLLKRYELW